MNKLSNSCSKLPRAPRARRHLNSLAVAALLAGPCVVPAQSIWQDRATPMYSDKRGTAVGDIITIVVQENTTTSKDNKTATSKQSAMDASIASFLYSPAASGLLTKGGQLPAIKMSSKNDFSGGGTIANTERMIARVAVQVIDVLPNRNLIVEGKRETSFSGEKQTVVLRGVVRENDVLANNTVFSYNVADATIQIVSKGTISDTQRKGWFSRIWDKVTPF
ncbi:MAG TPA: flagellar basal body L-ring protein FlgH [Verrucomicrobiae bacterium]|nr:flagellar basal body L-ring protein FlgH [Verrucomicrobiae bacterium]